MDVTSNGHEVEIGRAALMIPVGGGPGRRSDVLVRWKECGAKATNIR